MNRGAFRADLFFRLLEQLAEESDYLETAYLILFGELPTAAQQQAASQFVGGQFDVATLKSSFETSLRELRTDYVDMLIMHAAPESVLAQEFAGARVPLCQARYLF